MTPELVIINCRKGQSYRGGMESGEAKGKQRERGKGDGEGGEGGK